MEDATARLQEPPRNSASAEWTLLLDPAAATTRPAPSPRRVVARFLIPSLVAVLLLLGGSLWASGTAAQREGIADARQRTDSLAAVVVEPSLPDGLARADSASIAVMDDVLRGRMQAVSMVRVKIWTPDGVIVYSDEPRLIGLRPGLGAEDRAVLRDRRTHAELSDLSRPENQYERPFGELLEVYRTVETPNGTPLLLETYSRYSEATKRQLEIWRMFAPIIVAMVVTLILVQAPLAYRMISQLRAAQRERELLQARALDTSTEERRRIAGSLHDGIVQDVSASSLLLAGAAEQLRDGRTSATGAAETLSAASAVLRESVGSLRSLLVEIYPPNLARAGLSSVLADLATRLRSRGIEVRLAVADTLDPPLERATLLFRTAQETLLNVVKHARARHVDVELEQLPDRWVLTITDDGNGFDLAGARSRPPPGHLGLNVLTDLAAADGAALAIRTAPGAGTGVRLEVPRP